MGADYPESGNDLLLVGVLKGAVMFMTDLARALPVPVQLEFMAVSSYGSATSSSGVVRILKDLDRDIAGRDVLIVEDIIDSGLTLSWLLGNLRPRHPAPLGVCPLPRKPDAIKVDVPVRYVGFDIPNEFVVGYGLDYRERYRNLPFVATLAPHAYAPEYGRATRPQRGRPVPPSAAPAAAGPPAGGPGRGKGAKCEESSKTNDHQHATDVHRS